MATPTPREESNGEVGMIGAFFGGILGGMVAGSAADILQAPMNSMAFYVVGVLVGAAGGAVAAKLFARFA